jgi:hypothetical protein
MLYDLILSYMILYVYINIFYSLQLKHNIYIYGTSWDIYSGTPNTNRHTHTEHHLLASLLIMYVFSSFLMPYFFFALRFPYVHLIVRFFALLQPLYSLPT